MYKNIEIWIDKLDSQPEPPVNKQSTPAPAVFKEPSPPAPAPAKEPTPPAAVASKEPSPVPSAGRQATPLLESKQGSPEHMNHRSEPVKVSTRLLVWCIKQTRSIYLFFSQKIRNPWAHIFGPINSYENEML